MRFPPWAREALGILFIVILVALAIYVKGPPFPFGIGPHVDLCSPTTGLCN